MLDSASLAQDKWIWHEHARHVFLPVRMDAQSGATITCKSSEGEVQLCSSAKIATKFP